MREPSVDAEEVADNTQTIANRPPTPTDGRQSFKIKKMYFSYSTTGI